MNALDDWDKFTEDLNTNYEIDMSILYKDFELESRNYYFQNALWRIIPQNSIVGDPQIVYSINLKSVTLSEAKGIYNSSFKIPMPLLVRTSEGKVVRLKDKMTIPIGGLATWFTIEFNGNSIENTDPDSKPIIPSVMSTGPENGYTHWGQYVYYIHPVLEYSSSDILHGSISMIRTTLNRRMYSIFISVYNENIEAEKIFQQKYTLP